MKKVSVAVVLAIILDLCTGIFVYAEPMEPPFEFFNESIINMTEKAGFTSEDIDNYLEDYENYAMFMRDALEYNDYLKNNSYIIFAEFKEKRNISKHSKAVSAAGETYADDYPKTFYGNNQKYSVVNDYEKMNFSVGRMIYEETDLYLPGVNGLDFNLTLRFNQEDARKYSMIIVPAGFGEETSYHNLPVERRGWNEVKYGLGVGWSFGFYAFENWGYGMYLRLATGEVYKVEENNQAKGKYTIYKCYRNDLELYDAVGEYTDNTGKKSAYVLRYKTGLKEYFDAHGNVMATIDRYGNKIQYYYDEAGEKISSVIDSAGRVITFDYYYPENASESAYVRVAADGVEMCEYTLFPSNVNEGRYELFMKSTPQSRSVFQYDYLDVYESLPRTTGAELNKQTVLANIYDAAGRNTDINKLELNRELILTAQ